MSESVNELAVQVQQGREDMILPLWQGVEGFVWWQARIFFTCASAGGRAPGGVEVEDLVQAAYFAVLKAARHYDPEQASFLTILKYYLLSCFEDCTGWRKRKDPLNSCLSLDAIIGADPDGPALYYFAANKRDDIEEVDRALINEQLHKALETALEGIPAREALVLENVYFYDRSLTETAAELGVSAQRAQQLHNSGLHHIRYSSARKKLEEYLDQRTDFYRSSSIERFHRTHSSVVEELVLFREKLRQRMERAETDDEREKCSAIIQRADMMLSEKYNICMETAIV